MDKKIFQQAFPFPFLPNPQVAPLHKLLINIKQVIIGWEEVVERRRPSFVCFLTYSRTSTNGHLSTTTTLLADSPYIDSCLILSTTATFFCPQGGRCEEVQLYSPFIAG